MPLKRILSVPYITVYGQDLHFDLVCDSRRVLVFCEEYGPENCRK